ncbi:hypothetical protein Q4575_07530 [Psychrosphaera sp. 1_MG-2023]|uniref:hypothetical protein n=1 Tax=Psychrosphaera sp. 1_MG-2023 TaxID=3062643 RepID=UPI0026E2218E|nr:hypothetical protein [Psychrosphaera sp. 1_MG-2023]MDO6719243.1 hypothetical protein [Psychrosphaera sp. 1_MG-2023]
MKNSLRVALFGITSLASTQVFADVWFAPRVEYSFTQYQQSLATQSSDDIENGNSSSSGADTVVDLNLITIGGGATFGIDAFYVDIDVKTTQDSELHGFYNDQYQVNDIDLKDNGGVDRSEVSLTTGFGFEHFSLFGGVKITSTEFQHDIYYDYQNPEDSTQDYPAFLISTESGNKPLVTNTTFDSTGIFGGISVQFTFGESGALALSAAYSKIIDADLIDDWHNESSQYNLNGTGQGLSANAKLSYGWLYAKAEYAKYDYTGYEPQDESTAEFNDDVTEEFLRLGGGISILF